MNSQLFDDWFKSWVKKNSEQDAEFIAPNPTAEEAFAGGYAAALRQSGGGMTFEQWAKKNNLTPYQISHAYPAWVAGQANAPAPDAGKE